MGRAGNSLMSSICGISVHESIDTPGQKGPLWQKLLTRNALELEEGMCTGSLSAGLLAVVGSCLRWESLRSIRGTVS